MRVFHSNQEEVRAGRTLWEQMNKLFQEYVDQYGNAPDSIELTKVEKELLLNYWNKNYPNGGARFPWKLIVKDSMSISVHNE